MNMKERNPIVAAQQDGGPGLVERLESFIPDTYDYDQESDGYYDTPFTFVLREAAAALSDQAARIAELIAADEIRVRDISRLTVERDEARAECEGLRAALEEIANPLDTMRRRAAETGRRLDGAIANTLANDANHLKQIARAALNQKETGYAS